MWATAQHAPHLPALHWPAALTRATFPVHLNPCDRLLVRQRYHGAMAEAYSLQRSALVFGGLCQTGFQLLTAAMLGGGLYVGGGLVISGRASVTDILQFAQCVTPPPAVSPRHLASPAVVLRMRAGTACASATQWRT